MDTKDVATLAVASLGLVLTVGQIYVARGQRALQDATNQGSQVSAWNALLKDWQLALLVSVGPDAARYEGVYGVDVAEYRRVLKAYMKAEGDAANAYQGGQGGEIWEKLMEPTKQAREDMQQYKAAVGRVLTHLSHVAGLVFRGNLSVLSAYNAVGWSLVRYRHCIDTLTRIHPVAEGCPGAWIPEYASLSSMSEDEASRRVGWATELADHPGQLVRIQMLADLMAAVALSEGDVYSLKKGLNIHYTPESDMRSLQAACRKVSRFCALRILWKLDKQCFGDSRFRDKGTVFARSLRWMRRVATFPRRWRPFKVSQAKGHESLWLPQRETGIDALAAQVTD